jgi:hypothetical protein
VPPPPRHISHTSGPFYTLSQERRGRFRVSWSLVENVFCGDWKLVQTERICSTTWYADTLSPTCLRHLGLFQSGEELPEAERPSISDVAQNGGLAIIAGSDTTSSVLTALLYYLLLNPGAYKHLQEEVDLAFTVGEEPLDTVKCSHMEWLNGCM